MPAARRLTPALRGRRTRAADKLRLRCWVLVLFCLPVWGCSLCVVFLRFRLLGLFRLFVRRLWFGRCPRGWRCVRLPVRGSCCVAVVAAVLLVASSAAVALLGAELRGWVGGFLFGGVRCVGSCCWFPRFAAVVAVVASSRLRFRSGLLVVFVLAVSVASLCCCSLPVASSRGVVFVAGSAGSFALASLAAGRLVGVGALGLRLSGVSGVSVVACVLPVGVAGVRLGRFARCSWSAASVFLVSLAVAGWRPLLIGACLLGAGFLPVPFFYVTTCAGDKKFGG